MELFSDIVPKCVLGVGSASYVLTFDQDSRELQATLYWRVQVIRIFSVTSIFSYQVKDVIERTPVQWVIRMRPSTGELHAREDWVFSDYDCRVYDLCHIVSSWLLISDQSARFHVSRYVVDWFHTALTHPSTGGDFINGDGTGSFSIYGKNFPVSSMLCISYLLVLSFFLLG